ncbi:MULTISPECIES: LysR family transcriptional regulator [Vibrio]|uniref:LysR family transcriptional regulator n=1 Tax=Vibrio coralliilyticus TaxID=190893 RepID=A0AAN0SHR8_9VIBR|nr:MULTISPECIES: LysR family transcriptional regulator [Vibrio]AIW22767.1 LysR family transcriptional regulator [Vibrio coralliilyticus]MCM5510028.1 LysR family transcriptional regulator [Vibrio sp. SCSIO 43169]NOH38208.1 LysR family transcriptional regulator [Vibrio coralliilyticus]NOH55079.1 LysR family transcriptional regulator [Vibrio coralliilyticus]QFT39911.1 Hca operon transcriptional activator [Vibrio sp. THAF64]
MEFRYLKYFVTVAETRHFTRAAEQLGIAQPPLSQQIKKLERELGVTLFVRRSRGVTLTEAGHLLLDEAREILAKVEQLSHTLQQRARGEHRSLRLGFASSTTCSRRVLDALRQLREQHPGLVLHAEEHSMPELAQRLTTHQLDVAVMRLPCYACATLQHQNLFDDPFVAVIPAAHPLSLVPFVTLSDLHQEPVLMFPRETGPALSDQLEAAFAAAQVGIDRAYTAPQLRTAITMAQAGLGIAIAPASLTERLDDSVCIRPLQGHGLLSHVALVWAPDHQHPGLRRYLSSMAHTSSVGA